jgi:hypothetical protein
MTQERTFNAWVSMMSLTARKYFLREDVSAPLIRMKRHPAKILSN